MTTVPQQREEPNTLGRVDHGVQTERLPVPVRYVDLRERVTGAPSEVSAGEVAPEEVLAGAPTSWVRPYIAVLVALDALAIVVAGAAATWLWFGTLSEPLLRFTYIAFVLGASAVWVAAMAAGRAYEPRFLGLGSEEFRRVGNGAVRFTALTAMIDYALDVDPSRRMVAVALPAGAALTLLHRYAARRVLHRIRGRGVACHRVLLVGEGAAVVTLERRLASSPHAGLRVVGRCGPGDAGSLDHVRARLDECRADTVAVAHSPGVAPEALRHMAWALEGTGVDLLVAPAFTDVAGPRIHVRPVSGLPLLQIASPRFSGGRWLLKRSIDLASTLLLMVALSPLLICVALVVALTSRGPVLFTQERIGRDGKPFRLYKFRSMCVDAESRRDDLLAENDCDGVLFKLRDDPRVTRVGRWLRRYSLDELPQLANVLRGQMSMVGPRPPLPSEVEQYEQHVHRRLLVTPGLTGLWQVSGRAGLSWEETVRLDLYYVENWSVALDAEILWKTVFTVARGSGAH